MITTLLVAATSIFGQYVESVDNWELYRAPKQCHIVSKLSSGTTIAIASNPADAGKDSTFVFLLNNTWASLASKDEVPVELSSSDGIMKSPGPATVVNVGGTPGIAIRMETGAVQYLFKLSRSFTVSSGSRELAAVPMLGTRAYNALIRCGEGLSDPFAE